MSHFYRLVSTGNKSDENCKIYVLTVLNKNGERTGSIPIEWRRAMAEIPLDPPWPHCQVLHAPCVPEDSGKQQYVIRRRPGAEMPDIKTCDEFAIVSAKAKAVIEANDDMAHEFIPATLLDEQCQPLATAQAYYLLNVRRVLQIEETGGGLPMKDACSPRVMPRRCFCRRYRNTRS